MVPLDTMAAAPVNVDALIEAGHGAVGQHLAMGTRRQGGLGPCRPLLPGQAFAGGLQRSEFER
jgi:hypothetical protein